MQPSRTHEHVSVCVRVSPEAPDVRFPFQTGRRLSDAIAEFFDSPNEDPLILPLGDPVDDYTRALNVVAEYVWYLDEHPGVEPTPGVGGRKVTLSTEAFLQTAVQDWEREFLKNPPEKILAGVLSIAYALGIQPLQGLLREYFATLLIGRSPDSVALRFGHAAPLTDQQREALESLGTDCSPEDACEADWEGR